MGCSQPDPKQELHAGLPRPGNREEPLPHLQKENHLLVVQLRKRSISGAGVHAQHETFHRGDNPQQVPADVPIYLITIINNKENCKIIVTLLFSLQKKGLAYIC